MGGGFNPGMHNPHSTHPIVSLYRPCLDLGPLQLAEEESDK